MPIQAKLTQKDYIRARLYIMLTRIGVLVMLLVYFLFFMGLTLTMQKPHTSDFIIPFFFVVLYPFLIIYKAILKFKTTPYLGEQVMYQLGEEFFSVKGETFESRTPWLKMYKILKLGKYVILYQGKYHYNIIPIQNMESADLNKLKMIIGDNQIKNNMSRTKNDAPVR